MAKPIQNSKPHHSLPNSHVSPDLITPAGTPPSGAESSYDTAMESRLHQFMSSFDAGTHSFDREERESPEERRMSFGSSDGRSSNGVFSDIELEDQTYDPPFLYSPYLFCSSSNSTLIPSTILSFFSGYSTIHICIFLSFIFIRHSIRLSAQRRFW